MGLDRSRNLITRDPLLVHPATGVPSPSRSRVHAHDKPMHPVRRHLPTP